MEDHKKPHIRPIIRSMARRMEEEAFRRLFFRGKWIIKIFLL